MTITELFLTVAETATDLFASDHVVDAWEEASALDGYTVGELAAHLARAVLTVETYLDRTPEDASELTDASGYFATVLADEHPVDSDLHRAIRARSRATAEVGREPLIADIRAATDRLQVAFGEVDPATPIEVLAGVALPVGEYLRTRLVELVVHVDDLAVSVGHEPVEIPEEAYRAVAAVLAECAARRHGGLATVRGLARRERHPDAVRAL